MIITIKRKEYTDDTTIGHLYIDGEKYWADGGKEVWTLEDTVRAKGIKVAGHTAIPEGRYNVKVTMSSRFKRDMPIVYSESDEITLKAKGIEFKGIRIHGGNTHANTEGCPLVAYNRPSRETIQGTAEKELTAKIKEAIERGENVVLEVVNLPQAK